MRQRFFILTMIVWGVLGWGFAQSQTESGSQEPEPAAEPAPAPRVPGEARSEEEWNDWLAIGLAPTLPERAALAQEFLTKYPESGLTANAHHIIARQYYQAGDLTNFVRHAELTISEVSQAVDMLSGLAFYYAERGQPDLAIDRANRALSQLEITEKPADVPAGDWINQLFLVRAEANYALGRAYLSKLSREESRVEDPHLALAVRHLEKALEFDPRHDYACFRLGFAKRNQNDAGGALMAYGRAVAIGGVAAGPAMQQLEEVLGIVKEVLPDSPWARKTAQDIVNEANSLIQTELARVQTEKTTAAAEIESREPPPSADQSAGPGTTPG